MNKISSEIKQIRREEPDILIRLELFGGEPIQANSLAVVEKYLNFARLNECPVSIVSNGYELYENAPFLMQYRDIISQVASTLDGLKSVHDKIRIAKNKKGSFAKIVKAIDLYLKLGINVTVSTNICKENIDNLKNLLEFYSKNHWTEYPNFIAYISQVISRTSESTKSNILYESDILKEIIRLFLNGGPDWLRLAFLKVTESIASLLGLSFNQNEYGRAKYHYCWATSPILMGYYVDNKLQTYHCVASVGNKDYSMGLIEDIDYKTCLSSKFAGSNLFTYKNCFNCEIGGFCGGGCVLERDSRKDQICDEQKQCFQKFITDVFKPQIKKLYAPFHSNEIKWKKKISFMKKFLNKEIVIICLAIVIEQTLVALSTYFIANLGKNITRQNLLFWLLMFTVSLTLVFIPRIMMNFFSAKAKRTTFENFIKKFQKEFYNKPQLSSSRIFEEKYRPYFNNQTWQVINETYDFFRDSLTTLLNILFNLIVICWQLHPIFLLGYGLSFLMIELSWLLLHKKVEQEGIATQIAQTKESELLLWGWKTILIGNSYNVKKWSHAFFHHNHQAMKQEEKYTLMTTIISGVAMIFSILPVIILLIYLMIAQHQNFRLMAALIATLPRQMLNLQYLSILVENLMHMSGVIARVKDLEAMFILPSHAKQWTGTINWKGLKIISEKKVFPFPNLEDVLTITNNFQSGRFVLKGENGSGKTVLLSKIKEKLKDSAYYLPASTQMYFETTNEKSCSTGEKLIAEISEFIKSDFYANITVVLLDEWDANLDLKNMQIISNLITSIAKKKCVLESRHRS